MNTQPTYREKLSGKAVDATGHVHILKTSDIFPWKGVQIAVSRSEGWHVDDLMVDGHLLCCNLATRTLNFRMRSETDWMSVNLAPMNFWINPEGKPFSIHHDEDTYFVSIFIDGSYLDEVCGRHFELRAGNAVVDEVLACIVSALIATLDDKGPCPGEVADELLRTFIHALAHRHGAPAAACIRGGIAPAQLKALLAWVEDNLQSSLTARAMAARVGLSAAHFSREFKRSTGSTPWDYVVRLRLEGARRLLEAGESASEAALRYGFADQSHLTRLFKLKYGLTPSSFVKTHRGWYSA